MLNPFCNCFNFWSSGAGDQIDLNQFEEKEPEADVCLDVSKAGQDVVIVKNGKRLCGSGGAICTLPIIQNKAYFEVKIQAQGSWGVGVATRKADLNKVPLGSDQESWVLRNDSSVYSNNTVKFRSSGHVIDEGDTVGVSYDHELLNFYHNGENLDANIIGIRGTVYPVFFVDDGAILDVQFSSFYHTPPPGFSKILREKSIL